MKGRKKIRLRKEVLPEALLLSKEREEKRKGIQSIRFTVKRRGGTEKNREAQWAFQEEPPG